MESLPVRYLHRSEENAVLTFDNVVIIVISTELTHAGLAASVEANHALGQQYPGQVAALSLAHFGVSMPNAELRRASAEAIEQARAQLLCAVQVLSGSGFLASAMRSVVTAIERIRPDEKPRKTCATIAEGATWIAGHSGRDTQWASSLRSAAEQALELAGPASQDSDEASALG
jgi:hypothetical protein